jgi:hypothetical protein
MVRCPHCGQTNLRGLVARAATWAASLAGGVAVSSTLAACYGAPCASSDEDCRDPDFVPTCAMVSSNPQVDDADGDGYCKMYDCNEADKTIHAGARDVPGDGIDQNCDGKDAVK